MPPVGAQFLGCAPTVHSSDGYIPGGRTVPDAAGVGTSAVGVGSGVGSAVGVAVVPGVGVQIGVGLGGGV